MQFIMCQVLIEYFLEFEFGLVGIEIMKPDFVMDCKNKIFIWEYIKIMCGKTFLLLQKVLV